MDMSLYLKFEEKYRRILLLREEEDRILVDDIADEKAKLATVKLQKKNDLELQIKTQTSAAVEDEFAQLKALQERHEKERNDLLQRQMKDLNDYNSNNADMLAAIRTGAEKLREDLKFELEGMDAKLKDEIENRKRDVRLRRQFEDDDTKDDVFKLLQDRLAEKDDSPPRSAHRGRHRANSLPPLEHEPAPIVPQKVKATSGVKMRTSAMADTTHVTGSEIESSRPKKKISNNGFLGKPSNLSQDKISAEPFSKADTIIVEPPQRLDGSTYPVLRLHFPDIDPKNNQLRSLSEWRPSDAEPIMFLRRDGQCFKPYTNKFGDDQHPDWVINLIFVWELYYNPVKAVVHIIMGAWEGVPPHWQSRDVWIEFKTPLVLCQFVDYCKGKIGGDQFELKYVCFDCKRMNRVMWTNN
jgi:hypothetical protein